MRSIVGFAIVAAVSGACSKKAAPPKSDPGGSGSAKPAATAPTTPPPPTTPAPTGPATTDLSILANALPATVVLPPGATVDSQREDIVGVDGFTWSHPIAVVTGGGLPGTIELSTGAKLGWTPTTLAADRAERARQSHAEVAAEERPDGTWAAAYKLTDSCYLHAWSPSAKIWCEASAPRMVGVACDRVKEAMAVCLSIAPAGKPASAALAAGKRFPNLRDAKALDAIVAAGRAIATDDLAALHATLGPAGLKVGKKQLTVAALDAAVAKAGSLSKFFGNDCTEGADIGARSCTWNSEGDGSTGAVSVLSTDGYGEVATFDVTRQADGAWLLTGFRVTDLGEP